MEEKTVFVSYSSKDKNIMEEITESLGQMGIHCLRAPECIPEGSTYSREVPKIISKCTVFLLMLSRTAQESIWVEKEMDCAIANRKEIIPFILDGADLNQTYRFYLSKINLISYFKDEKWAYEELKRRLSISVSGKEYIPPSRKEEVDLPETTQIVSKRKTDIIPSMGSVVIKNNKMNAVRINRVPVECQYCGSRSLEHVTLGTYRCSECAKDNYDDFQTIRNYLEKSGPASIMIIEKNTGVPRKIINRFFQEEYLEIAADSLATVPCECCGAPIRTGMYCDACKHKKGISSGTGISTGTKGSWYS